jgi:hypothetical protein
MAADPMEILAMVVSLLDTLQIPYLVGGSFASSLHGATRSTRDADIVALLTLDQGQQFASALDSEFYADEEAIRRAIAAKRSFNVIHPDSSFKVDIFVAKPSEFESSEFERRQKIELSPGLPPVYVATAEDTILAKLRWYRLGNEVSDQQWRDLLTVTKVQRARLDLPYLRHWAVELGVADLLARALEAAGISEQSESGDESRGM